MYSANHQFYVRTDLSPEAVSALAEKNGLDRHFIIMGRDMLIPQAKPHGLYQKYEMRGVIDTLAAACSNDTPFPPNPQYTDCATIAWDALSGIQWGIIYRKGRYRVLGISRSLPYIDSFPGDDINIVSKGSIYGLIVAKYPGANISIYVNEAHDVWLSLTPAGKDLVKLTNSNTKTLMSEHTIGNWVYCDNTQIIIPIAKCDDMLGHNLIDGEGDTYDVCRESEIWFYCKHNVGGDPIADMLRDGYARYLEIPIEG